MTRRPSLPVGPSHLAWSALAGRCWRWIRLEHEDPVLPVILLCRWQLGHNLAPLADWGECVSAVDAHILVGRGIAGKAYIVR